MGKLRLPFFMSNGAAGGAAMIVLRTTAFLE